MKKIVCLGIFCFAAFFCGAEGWARHQPISTDRPDAAEASGTVGKKHFQIETSFSFLHDRDGNNTTRIYSFPTLLRYGIFEPLELRMESETFAFKTETGQNMQNGFTDMAVGAKAHFFDQSGWRPSFGGLFHMNLPTGKAPFSSRVAEPIVKALADWDLPADFSLGTNIGLDVPVRDDQGDKYARFLYAIAVGHPLPFGNERWRIFLETAGLIPLKEGKNDENTLDTGITFLATSKIQLDVVAQIGLSNAAPDITTGIGFSWNSL